AALESGSLNHTAHRARQGFLLCELCGSARKIVQTTSRFRRDFTGARWATGERVAANGRPRHPNAAAASGAPPLGRGGVSRDKGFSPSTPGSPPRVFQRGGVARVGWSRTGPAHWQPASSGQGAATAGKKRDIFMQRGERSPAHDDFVVLKSAAYKVRVIIDSCRLLPR